MTAIDSFQLQRATATGNAIVVSLATLFPEAGIDVSQFSAPSRQRGVAIDQADKPAKEFTPVAPGSFTSAAIIMLTDGKMIEAGYLQETGRKKSGDGGRPQATVENLKPANLYLFDRCFLE